MSRFFFLILLLVWAGLSGPVGRAQTAAADLPPRPAPFRFVTDQAGLLTPADAQTLESGLRRYADNTGTQIVVVTVPTLGGRDVADYGRTLGEAWGVGQRDKNNGIVLLLSGQERQVTIQAGSGLRARITPELTQRVISQEMAPSFKQGRYFAGLRTGLNSLMLAVNPESAPQAAQSPAAGAGSTAAGAAASAGAAAGLNNELSTAAAPAAEPYRPAPTTPTPQSSGLGIGTLLIGALVIGGGIWLLLRLFRRKTPAAGGQNPYVNSNSNNPNPNPRPNQAPDFLGNQPTGGARPAGNYNPGPAPQPAPDFLGSRSANMGGGGLSSGMGGILATGAAAAAGAYLGNRLASGGHETNYGGNDLTGAANPTPSTLDPTTAAAGIGGATAGGFPALDGVGNTDEPAPDYFSDPATPDEAAPDYFAPDDTSSYDDTSSDDFGGGGFDDDDSNSGSW